MNLHNKYRAFKSGYRPMLVTKIERLTGNGDNIDYPIKTWVEDLREKEVDKSPIT